MKYRNKEHFESDLKEKLMNVLGEVILSIGESIDEEVETETIEDGFAGTADLVEWYQDFLVNDWPEIAEEELMETGFYS